MRRMYVVLAILVVTAVVAQFFLAAAGAFDTAPKDESFRIHRALGYAIVLLAVVSTIVAALARMPGRIVGMTALIAGLVLVQGLIRAIADAFGDAGDSSTTAGQLVFGLHALNGLAILELSGNVVRRARALPRSAPSGGTPGAGDDTEVAGPAVGPARPAS